MRFMNGYLALSDADKKNLQLALVTLEKNLGTTGDKKLDAANNRAYIFVKQLAFKLDVNVSNFG
jgi:hypothetical protein